MRVLRIGLVAGLFSFSLALPAALALPTAVSAAPGDIGVEGLSYAGASAEPTGEKPESKTWFNDGIWWGSLWDTASSRYEIFRLNTAGAQPWTSTNVPLDTRSNSRADTLWDGTKLYVASHVFTTSTPTVGSPSFLYRFSYDAATDAYSLDATWPQQINNFRTETLVIDKDSTGQLWATWVQNDAGGQRRVHVNRTTTGDSGWGAPFVVPGNTNHTRVANDDIASVIAFGGATPKIGVFWSNQRVSPKTFNFIVHDDSAPDATWSASVAIGGGTNFGDDHINLKSLASDGSGRVFALIKTSNTSANQASIVLLSRSSTGTWTQRTVWTVGNGLTRPIVLLDTSNSQVHAFASTEGGGKVYHKSTPLSAINFATGLGTVVMADASQNDINNVTSGKGNVSSATGLLVLASNQTTKRYWHHFESLGGGGGNVAPVCGTLSMTVAQDNATGADVTPSCTDANGDALTYAIVSQGGKGTASVTGGPGTWKLHYVPNGTVSGGDSFTYTANDGTLTSTPPATVNVTITPTGGGTPVTPDADTYVNSTQKTISNGSATTLWTRAGTDTQNQQNSYLRFTVSGVGSASSATLRLWVSDASTDAGSLYPVLDDTWTEGMLWDGQPVHGAVITDLGAVSIGAYRDIDVSSYVTGDGTYSFVIIGESTSDVARFHSREGANDPLLVVTP